jgi:hypothetical protein
MSRAKLRQALASRNAGAAAVAPLIGAHAARLEQVTETAFLTDPEIQARALRNAQALYAIDAVTVGAGLDTLAVAARGCEQPDHGEVLDQAPVQTELEAIRRLRPVLGERAGIALVLPASDLLAGQLGETEGASWCAALLMRTIRLFGAEEPDLLITVGESDPGPSVAALCDHFGMAHVHLGTAAPDGVVAHAGGQFAEAAGTDGREGWLYTTTDQIPAGADPRRVKETVDRLHA